jgi:hypothetical protein
MLVTAASRTPKKGFLDCYWSLGLAVGAGVAVLVAVDLNDSGVVKTL